MCLVLGVLHQSRLAVKIICELVACSVLAGTDVNSINNQRN